MPWIIHQEAIKNQESIQSLVDFPASNSWRIAGNLLQPDMGPSILWDVPLPSLFPNPNPVFFFWRCRGGGSGVNSPSSFRVFSCFFFSLPGWRRSIHSAATCMVQRIGRTEWVSDDGCIYAKSGELWFGVRSEEVPSTFLKFRGLETKRLVSDFFGGFFHLGSS